METGDRIFWGCILFVGVIFVWLGLLERFIPLWVGTVVGILAFLALLIYGPRPKEEKEEREAKQSYGGSKSRKFNQEIRKTHSS